MSVDVLGRIKAQVAEATGELRAYPPAAVDWTARAEAAAETFIPWLIEVAPGLKGHAEDVLNAPRRLREMWQTIRTHVHLPPEAVEAFDRQIAFDDVLRQSVTGEVVSKVVADYLIGHFPDAGLKSNGRSDYPDLYLVGADYSPLPRRVHRRSQDDPSPSEPVHFGAALAGRPQRPVRIPDGLEIKTCLKTIRVDCHHPHAGLHLAMVYREAAKIFFVDDIRVAFLHQTDYHEGKRNTTATTVKYSFGGGRFVSLLPPP